MALHIAREVGPTCDHIFSYSLIDNSVTLLRMVEQQLESSCFIFVKKEQPKIVVLAVLVYENFCNCVLLLLLIVCLSFV